MSNVLQCNDYLLKIYFTELAEFCQYTILFYLKRIEWTIDRLLPYYDIMFSNCKPFRLELCLYFTSIYVSLSQSCKCWMVIGYLQPLSPLISSSTFAASFHWSYVFVCQHLQTDGQSNGLCMKVLTLSTEEYKVWFKA